MPQAAEQDDALGLQYIVVHGHRRAYRRTGSGPALLLLHGLGRDSSTWLPVMSRLAEHFTVIAPDLLGHGASDKPRADYTLGAFANGMRDLLTLLGFDKATVVGHSFGGGVAMQYAYQFPERTERIILVAPGGIGREVSFVIRALTVPGAGMALAVAGVTPARPLIRTSLNLLARTGIPHLRDLDEVARIYDHLCDGPSRRAVRHVTSSVVDWRGQVVSMTDRAYLTALMPMCVIWGGQDRVIPAGHSRIVRAYAPGAQVHVLDRSGHFPHKDHPDAFVDIVTAFVESTKPASYHRGRWRALMRRGDVANLSAVEPGDASATTA